MTPSIAGLTRRNVAHSTNVGVGGMNLGMQAQAGRLQDAGMENVWINHMSLAQMQVENAAQQQAVQLQLMRMQTLEQIVHLQNQLLINPSPSPSPHLNNLNNVNPSLPWLMQNDAFLNQNAQIILPSISNVNHLEFSQFVTGNNEERTSQGNAKRSLEGDVISLGSQELHTKRPRRTSVTTSDAIAENSALNLLALKDFKPRVCSVEGCTTQDKGGGLCAKHGGGKPCGFIGCIKRVAGTRFCAEHGGTRKKRCSVEGCIKGDQGGGFCAAHGGGKRCSADKCDRRAVGAGLCWSHGGGKRCKMDNCRKSPRNGGYCKIHKDSIKVLVDGDSEDHDSGVSVSSN